MKDFFKMMFASALGFIIASFIFSLISMLIMFAMMGSIMGSFGKQESFVLQNNSVLNLRLEGAIQERIAESDPFTDLVGGVPSAIGMNDIIGAIRKAKNNDKIKGIYLDTRLFAASTATLAEIRQELEDFKESGKFIVAYADTYTQNGYYLASVADKVAINPQGMLDVHGIASVPLFYKDALQKLGIEMQLFKVGTYKSFAEPYTQTEMSEANREQVNSFITDIWNTMKTDMAASRNMETAQIDSIANLFPMLRKTDFLLSRNLVDTVLYESEMKDYVRELLGIDTDTKIPSATVAEMKSVKTPAIRKSTNSIALLYATGGIVSGNRPNGIQDKYFVNEIEKLRKDDDIKAVVFRINSGGGSAYASEQIWKAISGLKSEKPVVVSMGDMAASGGYYIACNADKIVAQPTTITGSIGIFGMFPNFSGTLDKLGIDTDVVKTNEFSDFGDVSRAFNAQEAAMMQAYVDSGYDLFLTRCAEGRGMLKDSLAKYAEGRVWTGNQAREIGLVDELGGVDEAIRIAAEMANLGKSYAVFEYPRIRSPFEEIFSKDKEELAAKTLKSYLGESYDKFMFLKNLKDQDYIQARIPYELNIK
ncbi:signal peptide peptidase SppA [Petrimonas sp.]|uniref:signal peptide peptidase SppA n=1 Tax=Petrimonas sp. TaxID=2023866 RepID=UPI00332BB739